MKRISKFDAMIGIIFSVDNTDNIFKDHSQKVNKLCWHPTEEYKILSGS